MIFIFYCPKLTSIEIEPINLQLMFECNPRSAFWCSLYPFLKKIQNKPLCSSLTPDRENMTRLANNLLYNVLVLVVDNYIFMCYELASVLKYRMRITEESVSREIEQKEDTSASIVFQKIFFFIYGSKINQFVQITTTTTTKQQQTNSNNQNNNEECFQYYFRFHITTSERCHPCGSFCSSP